MNRSDASAEAELIVIEELLRSLGWKQDDELRWVDPMKGERFASSSNAYKVVKSRRNNMTEFTLADEFTVILIKPESFDSARGCVIESYSGDSEILPCVNCRTLIEHVSSYLSRELGHGEAGFDMILISTVNGRQVVHDDFMDNGSTHSALDLNWSVEIDRVYDAIRRAIKVRVADIIDRRAKLAELNEIQRLDKERQRKIAADHAELARLRQLYPDA